MSKIGNTALDLLYPPDIYCVCCGKIIDETRTYRLCNDCMEKMQWIGKRTCSHCGKQLSSLNSGEVCYNCREHMHYFDRGFTCTVYGAHERAMIFSLKYNGQTGVAELISEIMYDRMLAEYSADELAGMYDVVIPVPITRKKKAERGFNQAALIAEGFGVRAGLAWNDDILVRTRETKVMKALGAEERRENLRGAFEIRKRYLPALAGARVLLIDDIYTTGATADAIACVLKGIEPGRITDAGDAEPDAITDDAGGTLLSAGALGAASVDVLSYAAGADMVR